MRISGSGCSIWIPSARNAPTVCMQSSLGRKPRKVQTPFESAAMIAARCEILLSPGTVISASTRGARFTRSSINQLKKRCCIQYRPQLPLRNKKDFVRERILNFCARRKTAHIDKSLIRSVGTFHKARFARNRRAVRIIAFCSFCGRGGGRRRRGRLRGCLSVFRWRRVWIKRLLCRLIFHTGFGGIARGGTPRACGRYLIRGTSRNKEPSKQR